MTTVIDRANPAIDEIMKSAEAAALRKQNELARLDVQRAELQRTQAEKDAVQETELAARKAEAQAAIKKQRAKLVQDAKALTSSISEWRTAVEDAEQTLRAGADEQTALNNALQSKLRAIQKLYYDHGMAFDNDYDLQHDAAELLSLFGDVDLSAPVHRDLVNQFRYAYMSRTAQDAIAGTKQRIAVQKK